MATTRVMDSADIATAMAGAGLGSLTTAFGVNADGTAVRQAAGPGSARWTALRMLSAIADAKVPTYGPADEVTITVPGATDPYGLSGSDARYWGAVALKHSAFTFLRGNWDVGEGTLGGSINPRDVVSYGPASLTGPYNGGSAPLVSFTCDSPDFCYVVRPPAPSTGYRIIVDGKFAHVGGIAIGAGSGGEWHIRIQHATRKPRKYEIYGSGLTNIRGVKCGSYLDRVWRYDETNDDIRGVIIGDSFTEGGSNTDQPTALWGSGFGASLPYWLGMRDLRASGSGATGYLANATGTRWNAFERLIDLTKPNPHYALIAMGVNDNESVMSAFNQVKGYLDIAQAALPNCIFFVFGKFSKEYPVSNDTSTQYRTGQKSACAGRKNVWYIDPVNYTAAGPLYSHNCWVTGGGTVYGPNGAGNADLAIGQPLEWYGGGSPDPTHPNEWGQQNVYAPRMAQAIRQGLIEMLRTDMLV